MTPVRLPGLVALSLCATIPLAAQIGHAPSASPFRDIQPGTTWELYGGTVSGSGGPLRVGPRDGPMAGLRVNLRARNTISLGFGLWGALTERTVVDPDARLADRFGPSVDQTLYGAEVAVQLNLTGGKTWHHLAPFVGLGLGAVKSGAVDDPAGYEFGTKFYFAPMVGSRVFVNRRMYLRVEGRGFSWNLDYPFSYSEEPDLEPGTAENPNALNPTGRDGQYVFTPTLIVGIGLAF
jgi:hypothetical protein